MLSLTTIRLPVTAIAIGTVAARALNKPGAWRAAAVFPRAVYLNRNTDWICLVPGDARGPLYVACANPPADWTAVVSPGDPFPAPDIAAAQVWTPPSRTPSLNGLETWLTDNPPPADGLGIFAVPHPEPASLVARHAAPIIARLQSLHYDTAAGLVGLGPGLTPSGDDFLAGLAIALPADQRAALAAAVTPALANTSPISAAYLRAALDGQASSRVHDALTGGATAYAALTAIGHTSGWDALAGLAVGVSAQKP